MTAAEVPRLTGAIDGKGETWALAQTFPCVLAPEIAVPGFKIRDLLRLEKGTVLSAQWNNTADLPVRVNGELIGWCEFEVVGEKLAVRLTELE
jgi:flagellar motor switch/type III secretory pathway protein FliN